MALILQPFTPTDFERLIAWANTEEILMQIAGKNFTFPLTVEQLELYISDANRFPFKVVDTNTNNVIGHCEYFLMGDVSKLGRVIIGDENNRGKGFGEQIIRQLVQLSFAHPAISMVELNVYDWNIAAIRCYEKVGFTINPTKKHVHEVNGKTWVAINMIIVK
jgi:RimJ/RimL family protein N-acetyltransferase